MFRFLLLTLLLCVTAVAQEVQVTPRSSHHYVVTLFSIRTSDKIEPSEITKLGQGEIQLLPGVDRSNEFEIQEGGIKARASLRRGFDPTGETRTVLLRVALERKNNLGRSVQSDSVDIDTVPVAVSVSSWRRRSRSAEESSVVAMLTNVGGKEMEVADLLTCCVEQLMPSAENAQSDRSQSPRSRRFTRRSSDSDAGLSILARLPLKSLLSSEQITSLLHESKLDKHVRQHIGANIGQADYLLEFSKSSSDYGSGDSEQRALAQGWAAASDPVLRGTAGVALFHTSPEIFGPLLAAEVESGVAQIPPDQDVDKVMRELKVVRTWRNTTPAYLASGAVLVAAILIAMGGRALLRRAVA